jgi:pyrrolidone-carboxylate peptidase
VTLPTTWGTAGGLDLLAYDMVIHIGLGVYDGHHQLMLESGAYNERRGVDAAAQTPQGHTIEAGGRQELHVESMQPKYTKLASAPLPPAWEIKVEQARPANAFLCNETHYRALRALTVDEEREGQRRLRAAYFLHIPYAKGNDYSELACAVASLIGSMVRLEVERG